MSIPHVILLFIGGPVVIFLFAYLLAYVTSRNTETAKRYKLGKKWDRDTLWFVGHPQQGVSNHHAMHAVEAADSRLPATTMVGGASGTW